MKLPDEPSKSIKRLNPHLFGAARICAVEPKPDQGKTLVDALSGEAEGVQAPDISDGLLPRCRITFVVFSTRPCDWDNYHTKILGDMLVHAKILPDDSWKIIESGTVVTQKALRKEDERTEIIIESI